MVLFGQKKKIKFSQLLAGSSQKLSRQASKSATPLCKHLIFDLIIVKHVVEGITELIRHLLDLELFPVNLVLNVINPEVQFGDVHLSVFKASLSNLESFQKSVNFVKEFLFPFLCFLSGNFQLFHVITNGLQLLFNIPELTFSQFGSLSRSFEFILLNTQFPGQFIKFLLIVRSHFGGFSQIFVGLLNLNLAVHGLALEILDLFQDTISIFGS